MFPRQTLSLSPSSLVLSKCKKALAEQFLPDFIAFDLNIIQIIIIFLIYCYSFTVIDIVIFVNYLYKVFDSMNRVLFKQNSLLATFPHKYN